MMNKWQLKGLTIRCTHRRCLATAGPPVDSHRRWHRCSKALKSAKWRPKAWLSGRQGLLIRRSLVRAQVGEPENSRGYVERRSPFLFPYRGASLTLRALRMISRIGPYVIALVATAMTSGQTAAQQADARASPQASPTSAQSAATADPQRSSLSRGEGLIVLDYQVIPVPHQPSLDLMGFHVLNKVAEGLYVGVGAYAPLVKGEYGGFMAFDVGASVQHRIRGPLFVN